MSSYGEHSVQQAKLFILSGKSELWHAPSQRLPEPPNWLFGKELSIKDINNCPVKTTTKPAIEHVEQSEED